MDAYAASLEPALGEQIDATVQAEVEPRVAAAVASQLRLLEDQLRENIRQEAGRVSSLAASAAETALEEKMGPLRAELAARDAETAGLRQRAAETDRNILDVLLAIGGICQEASGRMSRPAAPPPAETAPAQPGEFESPSVAMPEPPEPAKAPDPTEKAETPPALLPIEPTGAERQCGRAAARAGGAPACRPDVRGDQKGRPAVAHPAGIVVPADHRLPRADAADIAGRREERCIVARDLRYRRGRSERNSL